MSETAVPSSLQRAFPTFYRIARGWQLRPKPESVINESRLPETLKPIALQFASRTNWGMQSKTKLARLVLEYFNRQMAGGVTAEELSEQWSDAVPFPAVLKLNEPSLLTLYSLPKPIGELIVSVVRKTGLWRREQIDVTEELISHFEDGLADGQAESQLVSEFGDPSTAARLIRRAKLRNRSFLWQTYRRARQFVGLVIVMLIVCWCWLWVRFHAGKPNVTNDYIGERDAVVRAIPESDRAWPLYAQAITKCIDSASAYPFPAPLGADGKVLPEWEGLVELVDVQRVDGFVKQAWPISDKDLGAPPGTKNVQREYRMKMDAYSKALDELRQGTHWPALVQFAKMNQEAIDLALEGATKHQFGFLFRDPANEVWLKSLYQGAESSFEESTQSLLVNVLLPHVQALYSFNRLFLIECERAVESGDRKRAVKILSAYLSISEQLYHNDEFAVEKSVALNFSKRCWFLVRKILREQPQFFTNDDLRDLAHRIAAHRISTGLQIPVDSKKLYDDALQRLYTDDGHGNGHLTPAGTQLLIEQATITGLPVSSIAAKGMWKPSAWTAPVVAGMTVSRAELKQVFDHCVSLDERDASQPLWETNLYRTPSSLEYLRQITSTSSGRMKYGVLYSIYPFRDLGDSENQPFKPSSLVLGADSAKILCDATLVAIALELYHRRHEAWPRQLEQLTPDLLPTVPIDRFDGRPLKYKVVDGQPLVYSVGRNQVDDDGTVIDGTTDGYESRSGDWRLWPVTMGGH